MLSASFESCFHSFEVAKVDFKVDVKLPESGMTFECLVNVLEFLVHVLLPPEEDLLDYSQRIIIEPFLQEHLDPSSPDG